MKYKTNSEVLDYLEDNVKHGEVSIDSSNDKLIVTCVVRSAFRDPSIYTRVKAFLRNNGFISDFNGTHTRYYNEKNEIITSSEYFYNKFGENSSVSVMLEKFFNKPSPIQEDYDLLKKENEELKKENEGIKNELYYLKIKNNELVIKLNEFEKAEIKRENERQKPSIIAKIKEENEAKARRKEEIAERRKDRDKMINRAVEALRKTIPGNIVETNIVDNEVIETNIVELLTKMKSGCRPSSVKKYYESLPKIKNFIEQQPGNFKNNIVADYKLSGTLFSALEKLNIIETRNKLKVWIGGEITIEMCVSILEEISNQCRLSRGKRNNKKQKEVVSNQLSNKEALINKETEIDTEIEIGTNVFSEDEFELILNTFK